MRIIHSLVLAATLSAASWAQADTLKITVKEPLSATHAQAGVQALRALPQAADVYVSPRRRVYALELRDGQQIADSVLADHLTQVGQTVTRVKRSTASFKSVKARLKRSPHRYFKWN